MQKSGSFRKKGCFFYKSTQKVLDKHKNILYNAFYDLLGV